MIEHWLDAEAINRGEILVVVNDTERNVHIMTNIRAEDVCLRNILAVINDSKRVLMEAAESAAIGETLEPEVCHAPEEVQE